MIAETNYPPDCEPCRACIEAITHSGTESAGCIPCGIVWYLEPTTEGSSMLEWVSLYRSGNEIPMLLVDRGDTSLENGAERALYSFRRRNPTGKGSRGYPLRRNRVV